MIDRQFHGGPIVIRCDSCSPGFVETGSRDFAEAIAVAKQDGWTVRHCGAGHGWCHFCPDCVPDAPWEAAAPDLRAGWGKGRS